MTILVCWDGSSWVEPVLSKDKCVLLKDQNEVTPVRLEPAPPQSRVKHSITESLCSLKRVRVSTSLDPDQAGHYVGPDLGPKGLHKMLLARQKAPNLDF